jgi:hypothetical protein
MLLKIDSQVGCALGDVVAVDGACEGFVFHSLSYGLSINFGERLVRFDQRNGGDESGEFIASEERLLHVGLASHSGVLRVRHDGAADVVGPAPLGEDFVADLWMLFRGGIFLVIEVVQQARERVDVFVFAQLAGVRAHARFHSEGVFTQTF